jgi:hypothetical protein
MAEATLGAESRTQECLNEYLLQVLPDVYRNVFYFILEVSCASLFYFKN